MIDRMKDEMQYDIQPSVYFLPEERETALNIDAIDKTVHIYSNISAHIRGT